MSLWAPVLSVLVFLFELLKMWGSLFIVSFTNIDTIWIIVPIWLSWFFAEFFQEKEGPSMGNAISNGVVPLWVGIDWLRQITMQLINQKTVFSSIILSKYLISVIILVYGFIIIILGIKGNKLIKYIGRIREVTYFLLVFTPLIYGLIQPSYKYFIAIFLFFPLFYGLIEIIDRLTPEPEVIKEDKREAAGSSQDFSAFDATPNFPNLR